MHTGFYICSTMLIIVSIWYETSISFFKLFIKNRLGLWDDFCFDTIQHTYYWNTRCLPSLHTSHIIFAVSLLPDKSSRYCANLFIYSLPKKPLPCVCISAGTRTRSLWIRSPARYSIAPQRLSYHFWWKAGLYSSPNPIASSQHPAASGPLCCNFVMYQ